MHGDPRLLEVLRLPEPLRLLDADAGAGRQPARHLPRLGGRRRLLLLPHLVLVHASDANASAGKKAFVTNRIGDWGFMVAMFLTFAAVGSLDYAERARRRRRSIAPVTATAIALLLFLGAVRQVGPAPALRLAARRHGRPHPGLGAHPRRHHGHRRRVPDDPGEPDPRRRATTGRPTSSPGSACSPRCSPPPSPSPRTTSRRCSPTRRSASSATCSSPSASGAYVAAIFHMVTHAFFKALLFLGSGSVIHGMHDEQDMRRMGGAAQVHADHRGHVHRRLAGHRRRPAVRRLLVEGRDPRSSPATTTRCCGPSACVTALLTAFYMSRQVFLVFFGEERFARGADEGHEPVHPHESPWLMTLPLVVLAGLAVVGGGLNLPFTERPALPRALARAGARGQRARHSTSPPAPRSASRSSPSSPALVGIALGRARLPARSAGRAGRARDPRRGLVLRRAPSPPSSAARAGRASRPSPPSTATVVDGAVNGVGRRWCAAAAAACASLQTGFVRSYALGVAVGAVVLLAFFLTRAGV